jgi:beta-N-acetylhexosaminidase
MNPHGTLRHVLAPSLKHRRVAWPLVGAMVLLCASCGSGGSTRRSTPPRPSATASPAASVTPSPTSTAGCVERSFASLTEQQRVGQLFLLGLIGDRLSPDETSAIRTYGFGSVWFTETTSSGVVAVRAVADQVQALAADSTAGVSFFVAANQEGGLIQALRGPGFSTVPSAVEQGGMDPPTLQLEATTWGRELVAAGINMNFAPVMDVVPPGAEATNQPIGVLMREYGHDPATVGQEGSAFLKGMAGAGVVTTAKHFPGLGRVVGNTDDVADVVDGATTANDPYLESFRSAVDARVPFVMVALATYTRIDPDHLAAFSPVVIGQMLRGDLGFDGVVVSDDIGAAKAVAGVPPADRAIDFLNAGGELIISKTLDPAIQMAQALLSKAIGDPAFRTLVDEAAHRVLQAKAALGLLPCSGG